MSNIIKNIINKSNSLFRQSVLYQHLKKVQTLRRVREIYGRILGNWLLNHFRLHGDFIHLDALKMIIKKYKITSIVETGTYLGYTTMLLAKTFPDLQVYSGEISKEFYLKAKQNTKSIKNIHIYNMTSPEFIEMLIKNKLIGDRTFFYLDAHWLDDWPLEKELQIISSKLKSALISIDDFKVDNDDRFVFDKYKDKECALSLVNPNLNKNNNYNLLFPNYYAGILFRKHILHPDLIGYVLIFQNMSKEFKEFKKNNFVRKFFLDKSNLVKPNLRKKR